MARVFITGSSDGLGRIAAQSLISQGYSVTLHARNTQRAEKAAEAVPGAAGVLIGDLSSISQTKSLASEANKSGSFDIVMHNAGLGYQQPLSRTEDGIPAVFAVNTLAPYILTCLMHKPNRLIYLSSGLHFGGDGSLKDLLWKSKHWNGLQAYSDSKLHDVMLAFAVARAWPGIESNAADPGWVKTKMGGMGAPGDAEEGAMTGIHLAGAQTQVGSGRYWSDMQPTSCHVAASDVAKQEELLRVCSELSGVALPR